MRRIALHRWSLILLVVARLVLGEFSHAMPLVSHSMDDPGQPTKAQMSRPMAGNCADHVSVLPTAAAGDSSTATSTPPLQESERERCCTDGCDCPCAHASAAVLSPETWVSSVVTSEVAARSSSGAAGPSADRIFRPPATAISHV